jgi:hypothetical protein
MNVTISAPATVQLKRRRRFGLIVALAALAVGVACALVFAVDSNTTKTQKSSTPRAAALQDVQGAPWLMSLTPARLAAGALGTGYALPAAPIRPSMATVLSSMSPETRRYTKAVMALTFRQLAAGAAGHP